MWRKACFCRGLLLICSLSASLRVSAAQAESPYAIQWIRQLGTPNDDQGKGVAADSLGNVYLSGYSAGSLATSNAGQRDGFAARYDGVGNQSWVTQWGTNFIDEAHDISLDGAGGVYVGGSTFAYSFLRKYDTASNLLWAR